VGGPRDVSLIQWEMAQARHLEDSATLAAIMEQQLRARVPMSARALQQAPFRVLVGANMPAALVEVGFLTNVDEEQKLASPERQTELVLALYESIVQFRGYLEGGRRRVLPAPSRPAGSSGPGGGS
jgi:N-acetylmuramoyl-L-alanine amidase